MNQSSKSLVGDINFEELIHDLNLGLIAVDPDWEIQFHNESARQYLVDSNVGGEPFWESLEDEFKTCFEEAYKKALLGEHDQLEFEENSNTRDANKQAVFEGMPLNLLEQMEVTFQFLCDQRGASYSVSIDLHEGHYVLRIEDISERVKARLQAERNREELEEALHNIKEARDANPLTGLPGNTRIQNQIQTYLDEDREFVLIYADLDNFKSFNDRYGFDRGDKAILLTRDVLRGALDQYPGDENFLGHVGGDDFVLLTGPDKYEDLCKWVVDEFNSRIKELYNEEDRKKGGIEIETREGDLKRFGFMTITLVVVTTEDRDFENHLAMTETAAELKSYAKENWEESTYFVDRRSDY